MKIQTELGSLLVRPSSLGWWDVFHTPSDERFPLLTRGEPRGQRVKLAEVHAAEGYITMFPTNMNYGPKFLQPKYTQIQDITVMMRVAPDFPSTEDDVLDLLRGLPGCFVKDYDSGLGFKQGYRHIVHAVEKLTDCEHLLVGPDRDVGVDPDHKAFHLSSTVLDSLRRSIDRVNGHSRNAANSVNEATARNVLAKAMGKPEFPVKFGRSPVRKEFTNWALVGEHYLPSDEHRVFLEVLSSNAPRLAAEEPKRVALAQRELELANLAQVIDVYESMIGKECDEDDWQQFFSDNPFALHLSFGYPVIKLQDKAVVGGRDFSGSGASITDFLVKNRMTHNAALVEIKTPQAELVSPKVYRQGVYAPHQDLVGAVNQVLDQRVKFERSFTTSRGEEPELELEAYGVGCVVIAGTTPMDKTRVKSFELFRSNSKNVDIITFDELLAKLKELRDFLEVRGEAD